MKFKGLTIGIPREIMHHEDRVAAIPETVKKMANDGATVLVESGAGDGAYFSDDMYKTAGAEITLDVKALYSRSDVILKVKEPLSNTDLDCHEVDMMHAGQLLITFIHPGAPANECLVHKLAEKGVTSITLDGIPRISRAQSMDALTSMSTVAGYKSVIMAADRLARFMPMIGTAVGMIQPATVFVIGIGVAGLQALATARRLGAVTYAADIRPEAMEQARSLGAKTVDTGIPAEEAIAEGGYAKALSEEWLCKERDAIRETVSKADILILPALIPGRTAPILITEEMVKTMKPGSAIVDIAIDQGGNCAITEPGQVVVKHRVSIDGTKNIPGAMAVSSTEMFAKNICNVLNLVCDKGQIALDRNDPIVVSSLVTIDGQIVHQGALEVLENKTSK